jgi:hypothetical protein
MMRYLLTAILMITGLTLQAQTGNIGFGTINPDSSAMLDITSNSMGLLIPRMTSVERSAIVKPAKGLMVFDSTTVSFWYYNGNSWQQLVPEPPPVSSDILFSQLDQSGIAGQNETTIGSWTMPAGTLDTSGESIAIHAFGENIADTALISFKFGTHELRFAMNNAGKWDARMNIYYKSATEVKASGKLTINGNSSNDFFVGTIDFSQPVSFRVTASQNRPVLNGVGMEGLVISQMK